MAFPETIPLLGWAWDDLLFLLLGGLMLAAAIFVVIGRDIVRAGLALIVAFAALAGIYVLAGVVIVAAAQVLIYIGAISVLILFAIMLTQTKAGPAELVFHRQAWAGALAAVGVASLLIISIVNTTWPLQVAERIWTSTTGVAMLLFNDALYVLALQVIAIMLTAAVVGGIFLAKREAEPDPGDRQEPEMRRLRAETEAAPTIQPARPAGAERQTYTGEPESP